MDAVMEPFDAVDFGPWPTAAPGPDRLLALSDRMSPLEVGTAMAVLSNYNDGSEDPDGPDTDACVRIRSLLNADPVIAPGGILLQDTASGATSGPGCCFGLENWRDWLGLMSGEDLWLGHDTAVRVEHRDALVRLWPEGGPPARTPIELPLADLPGLLQTVHDKLTGFLALAGDWASRSAPASAPALVAKLGADLGIGVA
ncbi:hypothetical protein ACFWNU_32785, partial [Streptomyces sp. NPDC058427]